ncbi:unnamed protein product [Effrenium voratum]|nr:unnamed protein product [Effrenium voratum]
MRRLPWLLWELGTAFWRVASEPQGFLWISQGSALPPAWLTKAARDEETFVLWGSFGSCERTLDLPRFWHVCLPQVQWSFGSPVKGNLTYTPGRNLMYRHALQLEEQQGRFLYLIFADDSGEFVLHRCSTSACGDLDIRPDSESESPMTFFQRLLAHDMPAVATPLNDIDDSQCFSPLEMRVCTSSLDHKVIAFHASAHEMLLPYEEGFERVSLFASQCAVNEILDSAFEGLAVRYRAFRRPETSGSSFPHMRPHYVRNLEPCLPQVDGNGNFGDSSVVRWLRPQLQHCAAEQLGPSHLLQAGCQFGVRSGDKCRLPGKALDLDYSRLSCFPWARKETCNATPSALDLASVPKAPRASGIFHVLRLSRAFGNGAGIRRTRCEDCAARRLCALGTMRNFSSLVSSMDDPDWKSDWEALDSHLEAQLRAERREVDHDCDVCSGLLLGAYVAFVDVNFLARNLRAWEESGNASRSFWNWWWCIAAFLHQNFIVLFEHGAVAPFDMLAQLTEQLDERPGASDASAVLRLAADDRPFLKINPSSQCYLGSAVRHLLDAQQETQHGARATSSRPSTTWLTATSRSLAALARCGASSAPRAARFPRRRRPWGSVGRGSAGFGASGRGGHGRRG